jgi:hypothetical protein
VTRLPDLPPAANLSIRASDGAGRFPADRPLQKAAGRAALLNNAADPAVVMAQLRITRWGADALPLPGETSRQLAHDFVHAMLGTLDDPASVVPQVHQWWSERMPWFSQAPTLLAFEHAPSAILRSEAPREV